MWEVVRGALAARRGVALILLLIALLAATAAAAAPWYAVVATQQVGVSAVENAPVGERLISIAKSNEGAEVPDVAGELRQEFSPTGFTTVAGGVVDIEISRDTSGDTALKVRVAARERVCDHLVVDGECPAADGQVILPADIADELGLAVGDEIPVESSQRDEEADAPILSLVGVFRVPDPEEPYWGDRELISVVDDRSVPTVTAFTVLDTLPDLGWVTYTYDAIAVADEFTTADAGELKATITASIGELRRLGFTVTAGGVVGLLDRIEDDRQTVTAGIAIGVTLLLLLSWFALVVVLRDAMTRTRSDMGWWRLRGAPSCRAQILVVGQSVVPLIAGGIIGATAGVALASGRWQASERSGLSIAEWSTQSSTLRLSLALVGLSIAGGLVAVMVSQFGTLRTPVRDLLRRIPMRRPSNRRSLVDLVIVVLAVAAIGQAVASGSATTGLPLLAPGLAAFALVLVAGWAVQPLATRVASRGLHAGRTGVALAAASVARHPGTHRMFALTGVAVALATTMAIRWDADDRTQWQRAALETGAAQVVDVDTDDAARLLAAVHAVDPAGTSALAVIQKPGIGGPPILALDSTRLGVIAGWQDEYGGTVNEVAAALRPVTPDPAVMSARHLELEAQIVRPGSTPAHLQVRLISLETGELVEGVSGQLRGTPDTYVVDVPACATGCRLVGVGLTGAEPGTQVELLGFSDIRRGSTPPRELITDPTQWRPALGRNELGLAITEGSNGLRLTVPRSPGGAQLTRNSWAFVADTPAPLPVVTANWHPSTVDEVRLAPLAGAVPIDVVATASLLPRLGYTGVLVDLEYAQRLSPGRLEYGTAQVWLAPGAPATILDDLEAAGLTPLQQESLSGNAERLSAEGSAVATRFQTVVALIGLLLAAGAVLVHASQSRAGRASDMAALRAQGVDPKQIRVAGYGSLAAITGSAVVVGVACGIAGAKIAEVIHPGFVDGWALVPAAVMRPYPIMIVAAVSIVVLSAAVVSAMTQWRRSARGEVSM